MSWLGCNPVGEYEHRHNIVSKPVLSDHWLNEIDTKTGIGGVVQHEGIQ